VARRGHLRSIKDLPSGHAVVELPSDRTHLTPTEVYGGAMEEALGKATEDFHKKYERNPDWDMVFFRGCFTTFQCVLEFWEDE
jgi:hypothetical protein